MVHGLIDPDLFMPGSKHLRPAAVRESVAELRRLGAGVAEHTYAVAEVWSGLSVHYQAPEQEKVLSLMVPATTAGDDVAQAMGTVAAALEAYADELDPIRRDMLALERRARAFRGRVADGAACEDAEGGLVGWVGAVEAVRQENEGLLGQYAVLLERVSQAVSTCADAVNRVAYPTTCTAPTSAFTAEQVMALEVLPWGPPSEDEDSSVLAQLNDGVKHDFLGTFAAVFGYDTRTERFSRATAGQAWGGGANLVVSVLALGIPVTGIPNATRKPREWVEGQTGWNVSGGGFDRWLGDRQKVVIDAGGSLVGYDPVEGWLWDDQPWRAGSATLLNLATIAVPAAKVGAGVKGASAGSKAGRLTSGAARTGAEAMVPGASWVVHGTQAVTRGAGALVRTGQWSAAVEAFRTVIGGPGLGRTRAGVAQALADLDKITPPVGQHPHVPLVSESVARSGTEPSGAVARQESWLHQDLPVEPSAAQRAADTPVHEPALVGADRPGASSAWHSDGAGPTGSVPGRVADAVTTQPISGLPRPSQGVVVPGRGADDLLDRSGPGGPTHGDGTGGSGPSGSVGVQPEAVPRGDGPGGAGQSGAVGDGVPLADAPGGAGSGRPGLGAGGHVAVSDPVDYPRPVVSDSALVHRVDAGEVAVNEVFAARTGLDADAVYHVEGRGEFYTGADGRVVYVKTTFADDPTLPNPDLMHPQPGTTYVVTPRIKDPVEGLNYDHVLVVSEDRLTVTWHADHVAPGDAVRNPTVQRAAGGPDPDYEGGHFGPKEDGGGFEFINLSEQLWLGNRGAGDLSFNNMNRFFLEMVDGNPTAITDVTITARYPEGATPTPTTYTPRGGQTYTGSINPRPDDYVIEWWEGGYKRDPLIVPNGEAGWLRATEELKRTRGEK